MSNGHTAASHHIRPLASTFRKRGNLHAVGESILSKTRPAYHSFPFLLRMGCPLYARSYCGMWSAPKQHREIPQRFVLTAPQMCWVYFTKPMKLFQETQLFPEYQCACLLYVWFTPQHKQNTLKTHWGISTACRFPRFLNVLAEGRRWCDAAVCPFDLKIESEHCTNPTYNISEAHPNRSSGRKVIWDLLVSFFVDTHGSD